MYGRPIPTALAPRAKALYDIRAAAKTAVNHDLHLAARAIYHLR